MRGKAAKTSAQPEKEVERERVLPSRRNPRLTEELPPYEQLLRIRKNGETNLGMHTVHKKSLDGNGQFAYVHLKAPLPIPLEDSEVFPPPTLGYYFLMRRAVDGFVSATGMFKCAFPWATRAEEEAERAHVRTFPRTSPDETAGNVWVHPEDAVILAEEYGFKPWIEALVDTTPVINERSRVVSPARSTTADAEKIGTPTGLRRSTRSASPSKRTPGRKPHRKTTGGKAGPKDSALKNEVHTETISTVSEETEVFAEDVPAISKRKPIFKMPKSAAQDSVTVEVDSTTETNGTLELKSTTVKVEVPKEFKMPETTEEMIAKAKEMVEAAGKLEGGVSTSAKSKGRKRKAEEVEEEVEDAETPAEEEEMQLQPAKKVKLESEVRKEKIRTRALIGLSATLAIGALLPYVL